MLISRLWKLILFVVPVTAIATPSIMEWKDTDSLVTLHEYLYISEDTLNSWTIEDVQEQAFIQEPSNVIPLFLTNSTYWIKFHVNNDTNEDLLLELTQAKHENVQFFYKNELGIWDFISSGYKVPISQRLQKNHFPLFKLPNSEGVQTYYLRLENCLGWTPIKLWDSNAYGTKSYQQKLTYGICLGLILFIFLYSLFLFISSRRILFLVFAFYTINLAAMIALEDGYILYFFSSFDYQYWHLAAFISIAPLGVILCLLFLETKKYTPKWNLIAWAFTIYLFSYLLWFPSLDILDGHLLHNRHITINTIVQTLTCILVWRKGNYLGGYLIVIVLSVTLLTTLPSNYLPLYLFEVSYGMLGMIIQALIIMFLFAQKIEWDRAESEQMKLTIQQDFLKETRRNAATILEKNLALQEANKKTVAALKARQEFLGIVSHELRTPMNAIMGFTELLKMYDPTEDQVFCIENLEISNKCMLTMIDNILVLLDLDTKQASLEHSNFDLLNLLKQTLQNFRDSNENTALSISHNIDPKLPQYIVGDAKRLKQILDNLIRNAVKFTPEGSVLVEVKALQQSTTEVIIYFAVKDTGIGIPLEKQALIFEVFTQASSSFSRNYDGLGIGLPITKRLLELHGGKIEMQSQEFKGSTFSFELSYPITKIN